MKSTLNRAGQILPIQTEDPRVKQITKAIALSQRRPDALIQILHKVQDLYGHLPLNMIVHVSRELRVPPSRVYGVATFYHYFSLKPKGEHNVMVCTGTACYVKGAQKILDQIEASFGVKPGETTGDNKLGLQCARCIGACGLAPAVVIDNDIHAKVNPSDIEGLVKNRMGAKT